MDTVQQALDLLAMHFGNYSKDSNIGKMLQILFANDEKFYQAADDMKNVLDLDHATGKNLDLIHGENKDLKRGGLTDDEYRERLKLETKVNNSDGDVETLEQAAEVLFGPENFKGITEQGDAKIKIDLDLTNKTIPNTTFERAVSASVGVLYATTDDEEVIQIVLGKEILTELLHFESGTKTTSQELGVILWQMMVLRDY